MHPFTQVYIKWCHNGRDGVSNHQPHYCILRSFFRRRSKKTPKLSVTGLCVGNSPVNPPHRWLVTVKCFHLMTLSWSNRRSVLNQYVDYIDGWRFIYSSVNWWWFDVNKTPGNKETKSKYKVFLSTIRQVKCRLQNSSHYAQGPPLLTEIN